MKCISFLIVCEMCFHFRFVLGVPYNLHQLMDENEIRYYFNTNAKDSKIPEYEIVEMRTLTKREVVNTDDDDDNHNGSHRTGGGSYNLQFSVFKRPIHLKLKPNHHLVSPSFKAWSINEQGERKNIFDNDEVRSDCYYLHHDENSVAAVNNCDDNKFEGIIASEDEILQIQPLNQKFRDILKRRRANHSDFVDSNSIYLVKRILLAENVLNISNIWRKRRSIEIDENIANDLYNNSTATENSISANESTNTTERLLKQKTQLTVEVGVFFDEAAYKIFAPLFFYNDRKLTEMLLAYMNGVQVIYHHRSLGIPIDITIVHMEIMRKQPRSLPTHNGERDQLLDSFCAYQQRINPPKEIAQNHWDMGLYISGLDFYGYENGVNSRATMGLATVRGICTSEYACVIAEFGVTNTFGRPYPSAGFTSIYILAHEMGHNLGMSHDSSGNSCNKEGYIMSPSRGTQGETAWSPCSAEIARELVNWADCLKDRPLATPNEYNAWKYFGYPGQMWSAKKQCELLLTDKDSMDSPTDGIGSICQNLQCRTPHRSGYFFAGPALEGTNCGGNNWCEGGYCSPKRPILKPMKIIKGGWSAWKNEKCISRCIANSKGSQVRRRNCNSPIPVNTNEGCDGLSYDVILCNDNSICRNSRRLPANVYASNACKEFSRLVPELDPAGIGLQAPHEAGRLWMGCAMFCRRKITGSFYTPRLELNNLGVDPYFPDGTLCHVQNDQKYFCLQHHCLPDGFQFNQKKLVILSEDVPISGNANPNSMKLLNSKLRDYLSLDSAGKPLLKHIRPEDIEEYHANEMWIDDIDYRIVPNLL